MWRGQGEVLAMTVSDYDSLDLDAGYLKGHKINDHPKPKFITAWTHGARRVSGQEGWETVCEELQHEVGIRRQRPLLGRIIFFDKGRVSLFIQAKTMRVQGERKSGCASYVTAGSLPPLTSRCFF